MDCYTYLKIDPDCVDEFCLTKETFPHARRHPFLSNDGVSVLYPNAGNKGAGGFKFYVVFVEKEEFIQTHSGSMPMLIKVNVVVGGPHE